MVLNCDPLVDEETFAHVEQCGDIPFETRTRLCTLSNRRVRSIYYTGEGCAPSGHTSLPTFLAIVSALGFDVTQPWPWVVVEAGAEVVWETNGCGGGGEEGVGITKPHGVVRNWKSKIDPTHP